MADVSVSTSFGALSTYSYPSGYDSTKLGLGPLMRQATGVGNEDKWVGPHPVAVARPIETSGAIAGVYPDAINWSTTYDWIILADNATAAATRRFQLYRFDKTNVTNPWSWSGFITCSVPFAGTQGVYTIRGMNICYEKYTTGTVSINNASTSLTGSGTTWSADRLFIGSRIGFGSTDPSQISTWYEISAIGSDTGITLTQNYVGSNLSGVSYVIEDLRILWCATNGTTVTNSGLYMTAGLRYENFSTGGTAISAAATTDKVRATYWLSDGNAASNSTIQSAGGLAIDSRVSWTSQRAYVGDYAAGQSRFMVSNFRAAMTVGGTTAGRDSTGSTFVLNTGQQAVTGTISQANNLTIATCAHGPRNGVRSLFWVTTTRFYSAALTNLTTGSTTFHSGVGTENPPGGTATYPALASMSSLAYSSIFDRFIIFNGAGIRHYVTQYREDAGQWDRVFLINNGQINQSTVDITTTPYPATLATAMSGTFLNGMGYLAGIGTTAITNLMYSLPLGADWEFAAATGNRIVLPAMDTSEFQQITSAFLNSMDVLGGKTGTNLGIEPGGVRLYYRTSGISDDSGSWTLVDYSGTINVAASSEIQAMLEFRTITAFSIPGRATRVGFLGTSILSDARFQFSLNHSDTANKRFAFRYATAFGGTVPTLYIRIYDAVTGDLLVTDDSVSQVGTWEKSTNNGSAWGSFNDTDRANETTYFRFTPASIADNVNALPVVGLT